MSSRCQIIVVVEDEPDILEVLQHNLSREGFKVVGARDGASALSLIQKTSPDLVLLDLMLPGLDGVEVCRRLRRDEITRATPIIMLTAKGEESDVILGLGVGADDYIVKPFSPREVVARVQAVLRRVPAGAAAGGEELITCGALRIDAVRHQVLADGRDLQVTATELRLMHLLASHPGRVFTREQLLTRVIGERALVLARNIDVHVKSLRRKLGAHRGHIETVRGVGYRFAASPGD